MLEKLSKWKSTMSSQEKSKDIDDINVPKHIAIIMDGNGRWAKQKGLPRIAGHREGMKVINKIVRKADDLGVEILTLYAFSTENWKRPKTEVDYLLKLPERFLNKELPTLIEKNVKVRLMGSIEKLPEHTKKAVSKAVRETENNTGLVLNFALNYGSRFELINAVKEIAQQVESGTLHPAEIDESVLTEHLMTAELRDPDLLIRTSGELRLSNFMLWQVAYSEFWFTDVLWPDFNEKHLVEAIAVYQKRARRYGGV
ncbi:isoprenyl transferase [Halalkalibacter okhensis]|uniref:Isoprenyl transferase n=1 Tax=Halalkalibacter okhensis TaxID=333138 RepID=A0A0B0IB05_9BACI|nr:isoprenyl transferase [Halalkalibacter okhensis]KHF39748.1 UDP pyrophosphate synthase [Halalkalibacter okhensis]